MRFGISLLAAPLAGLLLGTGGAFAQSAGLDEAVGPHGAVLQKHALTPVQKSAIYNAASQQKLRAATDRIAAAVGAPVPPSAELLDLPDQAGHDNALAGVLKYAFVENQVVVVDPIAMRVVDVIRGSARP